MSYLTKLAKNVTDADVSTAFWDIEKEYLYLPDGYLSEQCSNGVVATTKRQVLSVFQTMERCEDWPNCNSCRIFRHTKAIAKERFICEIA